MSPPVDHRRRRIGRDGNLEMGTHGVGPDFGVMRPRPGEPRTTSEADHPVTGHDGGAAPDSLGV